LFDTQLLQNQAIKIFLKNFL